MYIAILGRQPQLSMAELERCYGSGSTRWFSDISATITGHTPDIQRLGGVVKVGKVVIDSPGGTWKSISQTIIGHYSDKWRSHQGKVTLGISVYGFGVPPRDVQKTGIVIKQRLKKNGISLRLIPNATAELNTAASHHNKLGLSESKVELLVVRGKSGHIIVAESTGAQNITALAARDQARPKRDAFVGMLPPKLALLMINLAGQPGPSTPNTPTLLDPFCGTGVILQEAALLGLSVYGTDLSEKMIRYSQDNINWLEQSHRIEVKRQIHEGDAMTATWQQPINLVVSETYLGQPFSAPPSPKKLEEVRGNVNHITTTFLKNLHPQLVSGTPLCLAVPAWRDTDGRTTHLPFINSLAKLGYAQQNLHNVENSDLLYYREDQVVARQLLILARS